MTSLMCKSALAAVVAGGLLMPLAPGARADDSFTDVPSLVASGPSGGCDKFMLAAAGTTFAMSIANATTRDHWALVLAAAESGRKVHVIDAAEAASLGYYSGESEMIVCADGNQYINVIGLQLK